MQNNRFANIPKQYYKLIEAKHANGLSADTLRRLIQSGHLKPFKARNSIMIPADQIENLENITG